MINCYDNISENFICQLQKIKCINSDRVFARYREDRFGIETCKNYPSYITDLLELMEYIDTMDISNFSSNTYRNALLDDISLQEQALNGCISEFSVETLHVCNISNLIEKINSL